MKETRFSLALVPLLLLAACGRDDPAPACPPVPDTWLGLAHEWGPGIGGGIITLAIFWLLFK